jgi:outer membrane biogenesis lipoprotein LolB
VSQSNFIKLGIYNREDAATLLSQMTGMPITVNTLRWAVPKRTGPRHYWFGRRAVYRLKDLQIWAETKMRAPGVRSKRAA